jgi:hypothetical protein
MTAWPLRKVARYGLVLLAGIMAGGRVVGAYQAWQQWRLWRGRDPSLAEATLTVAEVDLVIAVLWLGVASLIWWLLRPRTGSRGGREWLG